MTKYIIKRKAEDLEDAVNAYTYCFPLEKVGFNTPEKAYADALQRYDKASFEIVKIDFEILSIG